MHTVQQTIDLLKTSHLFYTIIVGMDNNYTYVSPSYDRNFDFTGSSLIGKPFHITLHPDDVAICQEVGTKSFHAPNQLHEVLLRKHDGEGGYIHTHWEFRALFDEHLLPVGIFCIGYNITEHVETRNMVRKKSNQLNDISIMQSHVVRKPLANIIGLLQTFDAATTPDELNQLKSMLLQSADEMDNAIRKIVNF